MGTLGVSFAAVLYQHRSNTLTKYRVHEYLCRYPRAVGNLLLSQAPSMSQQTDLSASSTSGMPYYGQYSA